MLGAAAPRMSPLVFGLRQHSQCAAGGLVAGAPGVIAAGRSSARLFTPRVIDAKQQRLAREAFDISQRGECVLIRLSVGLGRGVAPHAVEPKSRGWMIERILMVARRRLALLRV